MKTIPSGVQGLDEIIAGGFIRPSTMLVAGPAGSGKTTFVMQSLFNAVVEQGDVGLFMPTISEPVAMVNNFMSQYSFYNFEAFEKKRLHYKDLSEVVGENWKIIIDEIRSIMEQISPKWVVIDPLTVLGYGLSDMEHRQFLNELFATVKGWDTMVLATGEFTRENLMESPYSYMVDGIIFLGTEEAPCPGSRYAEVLKLRGKPNIPGRHFFRIEPSGLHIYPRILPTREAVTTLTPSTDARKSTGVKGYDEMVGGGFIPGSTNLIAGSAGTGKTVFGLSFISAGLKKNEKGVVVVFEESPSKTMRDAEALGIPLTKWFKEDKVKILYYPPGDSHPEEVGWGIRNALETWEEEGEGGEKVRLLFDSMSGFSNMVGDDSRLMTYLSNLDAYLSGRGVTSVFTANLPDVMGDFTLGDLRNAMVMDSATILRYVEVESSVNRFLAVLMMKGSDHQKDIRQYTVDEGEIQVMEKFHGLEGLLSGSARKATSTHLTKVLREALPEAQRHLFEEKD